MDRMHPWLIWTILAAGLAAAEALSLDLVLIMCAGGAATAAIAAGAGVDASLQVVIAAATAMALLVLVRPVARRHLVNSTGVHLTGTAALVGREAVAMTVVDARGGRVRLNGAEWSARSFDQSQVIAAGATVRVMQIDGATAVVWDSEQV
jgi:membrane protein implicated in regulation of membrane protease activity